MNHSIRVPSSVIYVQAASQKHRNWHNTKDLDIVRMGKRNFNAINAAKSKEYYGEMRRIVEINFVQSFSVLCRNPY